MKEEILAETITPAMQRRANEFFDSMPFTTSVLIALHTWLEGLDDDEGAALVHEIVDAMAEHEAETT